MSFGCGVSRPGRQWGGSHRSSLIGAGGWLSSRCDWRPVVPASEIIGNMGIDDVMMEAWARGWHASDKLICSGCVGDDYLKAVVANAVVNEQMCTFCGAAQPPSSMCSWKRSWSRTTPKSLKAPE